MTLSAYGKYGSAASKLGDAVRSGIVSHAYIIEGDNNIDKMGFARAFCQALTCREMPGEGCGRCVNCRKIADGNHEDLYVVEPDDQTAAKTGTNSIKDAAVEELQVRLKEKPTAGEHNMAVISDGDTMTTRAQTRFLKTLEEPPDGTVIMILSNLGVIHREDLKKYRRHAIIVVLALAALITPSDPFSMFVLAIPLYGLYEFSILICKPNEPEESYDLTE